MFWRLTGRSGLPRIFAALVLFSFAIVLLAASGIFTRLGAQSTEFQEPTLQLAQPIRPDTLRMEWHSLQISAGDFLPIQWSTMQRPGASFQVSLAPATQANSGFTETYDDGTDVGKWVASFNVPRQIAQTGGSSLGGGVPLGAYLQQGVFSSSTPTWGTASPRYQPGFNDTFKEDSVFVGNWTAAGVVTFSVDLDVIQSGSWPMPGRPVTLQLLQMDSTGFSVNYSATYTTPVMATVPIGWTHYDFTIDANGQGGREAPGGRARP